MTCGANSMHLCGRKGVLLPFLSATLKLPWKLKMKNSCYFCMPTKCPVPTGLFLKDTFLAGVEWKPWHICVFPPASIRSAFGCLGKEWNHNRAEGKQTKPILPGSSPCSPWSLQQESRACPAVGYSALSWISLQPAWELWICRAGMGLWPNVTGEPGPSSSRIWPKQGLLHSVEKHPLASLEAPSVFQCQQGNKAQKVTQRKHKGEIVSRHEELLQFFCSSWSISLIFSRALCFTTQAPLTDQAGVWSALKKIMGLAADNSIFHCIRPCSHTISYWSEYPRLLSLLIKW